MSEPIRIYKQRNPGFARLRVQALSFMVVALCGAYAFLVVSTTVLSGEVRTAEREMAAVTTQIAQLEVEYFTKASAITPADVAELHMIQPTDESMKYLVLEPRATQVAMNTR
jgi:hypothetical protein